MKIHPLGISGSYRIENFKFLDTRGSFIKTFNHDFFLRSGLSFDFRESYYSSSIKNVLRGMHFQKPPLEHDKLVYVTQGKIIDVIVDLRLESSTYKKVISRELEAFGDSIYIPIGCAHGFLTISDSAVVVYNQTTVYHPDSDRGIRWNTIDYNWGLENPILSERDANFQSFEDFETPF